ncbi:MAG: hypothetical protein ACO4CI_03365 [Phycisphaerales bacterium]
MPSLAGRVDVLNSVGTGVGQRLGRRVDRWAIGFVAASCVTGFVAAAPPADPPRLGTNLDAVVDWGTAMPFTDLFKTSRAWISGNAATWQWDDGRPFDLDEHGWVRSLLPDQIARTIMLVDDTTMRVGSGRWIVRYEGTGTIQYTGSASRITAESVPGRDVVQVDASSSGGLFLYVTATDPANHLRNIRVIPEAVDLAEQSGTPAPMFTPEFLSRLDAYGVLRFMDWARTNNSPLASWSERPLPTDARWSLDDGVPLEVMVDLANETGAEPWFCVPHLADAAFMDEMAILIDSRLEPGRRVWIEHSNEVWNGIFAQATYAQQQGLAEGLSTDAWQAGWFWHSRRSVAIFDRFTQVFAAGAGKEGPRPLCRVMGGFSVSPWGNEQALSFENAHRSTDVLAIAPYFGHEWGEAGQVDATRSMTPQELVEAMRQTSMPETMALVAEDQALCESYGVGLVAYEGGHHLSAPQLPGSDPVHAVFHEAARSEAMGELYAEYLAAWDAATGGQTFVNFTHCGRFSQWGCWSVLEWITQPTTPREQALIDYANAGSTPCPADLDGDGFVGGSDLGLMLIEWGRDDPTADLDGNGVGNGAGMGILLIAWGAC